MFDLKLDHLKYQLNLIAYSEDINLKILKWGDNQIFFR